MRLQLPQRLPLPQELVHQITVGGGYRWFRIGLVLLGLAVLTVLYDMRGFRNMASQEAMDAAQVGRNLAEGQGFSTLFIRPLSIGILKRHNERYPEAVEPGKAPDPARLKGNHPDLANPPVYPVMLAGLMKVLPFHYGASNHGFWAEGGAFARYQPDFLITLFNQWLFLVLILAVFFLARRLFDRGVAWLSAVLLLAGELYWRFTVSGLSTILLLLIFVGLAWSLALLEEEGREPKWGPNGILLLAAAAGVLAGLGGLTRYSFGWLILPVAVFVILFSGPRRAMLTLTVLAAFAAVMLPWIIRNYSISGTPFGTAGYAIMEKTVFFPENRLQRSLGPDFSRLLSITPFWLKLVAQLRQIVQNELPRLGGSWLSGFFLVGLMVGFRNPAARRLRYFLLMCLPVLIVAQALGRTQLSEECPEINSENLLVLLGPLALVYGISLFYLLLDQIELPMVQFRYVITGLFGLVMCLPLILALLPPRTRPLVYPPYYPPAIQNVASYMKPGELIMSDIPWAVAWYGQRQSVWLTLYAAPPPKSLEASSGEDFSAIDDYIKPVQALYLTPATMDSKFLTQWVQTSEQSWGNFIIQTLLDKQVPPSFPLRKAPRSLSFSQIVLTDRVRWTIQEPKEPEKPKEPKEP